MTYVLSQAKALGGYFELELAFGKGSYYPDALKYQSARSAFYALLLHRKPRCVWMPYYICDTMLAPLVKAGVEIEFYSINCDFSIADEINLKADELILYVNYFGLCSGYQNELLTKFNCDQVIFDHSQAFFCEPKECLATIYSPRKFFGVPDGGLLVTSLPMLEPEGIDKNSIYRGEHLLKRLAGEPEDGYVAYQKSEESLNDIKPMRMSVLTERLLSSIDYHAIRQRRVENFEILDSLLSSSNTLSIPKGQIQGPLIYPYIPVEDAKQLKSMLIENRCFVATYWPECKARLGGFEVEKYFVDNLIALPCDQRVHEPKNIIKLIERP